MTGKKKQTTKHVPAPGFMTHKAQENYIRREILRGNMPSASLRVPKIVSLQASTNTTDPLYFWQLYSVLGTEPILRIVQKFYSRVFEDTEETWFATAFSALAPLEHHVRTQAAMWMDCFGGGFQYHGGDGRLSFHHQYNARAVMTQKGAERWAHHMVQTLDEENEALNRLDPRARAAINSFLEYFLHKYADEFDFDASFLTFGKRTKPISLRGLTPEKLQSVPLSLLKLGLLGEGVDIKDCVEKRDLIAKALELEASTTAGANR